MQLPKCVGAGGRGVLWLQATRAGSVMFFGGQACLESHGWAKCWGAPSLLASSKMPRGPRFLLWSLLPPGTGAQGEDGTACFLHHVKSGFPLCPFVFKIRSSHPHPYKSLGLGSNLKEHNLWLLSSHPHPGGPPTPRRCLDLCVLTHPCTNSFRPAGAEAIPCGAASPGRGQVILRPCFSLSLSINQLFFMTQFFRKL